MRRSDYGKGRKNGNGLMSKNSGHASTIPFREFMQVLEIQGINLSKSEACPVGPILLFVSSLQNYSC